MKKTWKLTIEQQIELREKYALGNDVKSICEEYGISNSTLYKILQKYDPIARTSREIPKDVVNSVIELHNIGTPLYSICKKTGVRWQMIYNILKSNNITIKFKTKIPKKEEKEICEMYSSGLSIIEISKKTKRARDTIAVVLIRNNIEIRSKKETSRLSVKKREDSPSWKNGRTIRPDGYVSINNPNHPCSNKGGYVLEHRMIISDYIGRPLKENEIVHHINGIKDDNRIENLMIVDISKHYGKVECPFCSNVFLIK